MQNRNVVARGRAAKHKPQRDAAQTIEFDCTAIANVLDAVTPKPAPDLDAEIEVVATSSAASSHAKDRFAHTLKRPNAVLAVEGSRSLLPLPAPPITEEEMEEGYFDTQEDFAQGSVTRAMAVVAEPAFEVHRPVVRAHRTWLLPVSVLLLAASVVALIFALV